MLSILRYPISTTNKITNCLLEVTIILSGFLATTVANAQVIPDSTVNTQVTPNDNISEITGGETRGANLFHSFQEFSINTGNQAYFNNLETIENIFSRVTGGSRSNIDGLISANGSANLFLLNPAGIILGPNASLDIGGSFYGSTADSIQFSDGIGFSATDTQTRPILTINAPIGLNFRENPGNIVNRASRFVLSNATLGLIGGNVTIDGALLGTLDGRIELGSVAANSRVSLTPIEQGFDVGYEGITNFQDIRLSSASRVIAFASDSITIGDMEVQGRNISLIQGSQIAVRSQNQGQAGNLAVIASESLSLDGNSVEINGDNSPTSLFNDISGEVTGEGSQITIKAPKLILTNGAQISARTFGQNKGVDILIDATEIVVENPFIDSTSGSFQTAGIFAQVSENSSGDGGNITINTDTLTLNEAGQITTDTFGSGNAGNLVVNAYKNINLVGIVRDLGINRDQNQPSTLSTSVAEGTNVTGNAGNLTVNTPQLVIRDGAQISTVARNIGDGGTITIDATESILLSGSVPLAEGQGQARSGITLSVQPSFPDSESGEIIPNAGNGGALNLTSQDLIVQQGASIGINTFSQGDGGNGTINVNRLIVRDGGTIGAGSRIAPISFDSLDPQGERGNGGNLTITATESVDITGIGDINGELENSSIFTSAQSTGDAGNVTLNTSALTVSNGGDINTSATGTGAAGNLRINAQSIALDRGTLTAATAAGTGGNITLNIQENLTLRNESLISTEATGTANGGNFTIENAQFVIAYPSQGEGNDILTRAIGGTGGNVVINAESLLNIQERSADSNNGTNDIDASGALADGSVTINTPDVNPVKETDLSSNVIETERTVAQTCTGETASNTSSLVIKNKGGLPPQPTEPFTADPILNNGQGITLNPQTQSFDIKPIKTSLGDIYPARGVIKTETGKIILTAYPTDRNTRTPNATSSCDQP